jgi:hypothetical protein
MCSNEPANNSVLYDHKRAVNKNLILSIHGLEIFFKLICPFKRSYFIVAPAVVRPAEKIKISVNIFNKQWNDVIVKALVFTDEQEVVSGFQECSANIQNDIAMIVSLLLNIKLFQYSIFSNSKFQIRCQMHSDLLTISFESMVD